MATILTVNKLSKSYVVTQIFKNVSFQVGEGEKVALVGVNGAGKTTLLKIIAGLEEADSGEIIKAKGLKITYLPQEVTYIGDAGQTLIGEMHSAFAEVQEMQARMRQLEAAMSAGGVGSAYAALMDAYSELSERFEHLGGYDYETRIEQVLAGLGFSRNQFNHPLGKLSGGQKTRAALAKALLSAPDLLLLDEPTNHLDLAALEWLEDFLNKWPGSVILISHDRYFLDKTTNRTLDMAFGTLEDYPGGYSRYLDLKAERLERRETEYAAQQEYIAKTEDFIRRYKAGQRYRQARGRQKQLDRLERIARPDEHDKLKLQFNADLRSGQAVLVTDCLAVGYRNRRQGEPLGERILFRLPDVEARRGERVALVGPNGSGKSTLLKTIVGELPPLHGTLQLGSNVIVGYYAQAHEGLNLERDIISEVMSAQPMSEETARNLLARFMFTGDEVYRRVGDLSGGERSRVALAKLTLARANFLILDEPTNHLDINAREALEDVLRDYPGTLLFVSHDRYFIDAVATHTWVVNKGRLDTFVGNYSDYQAELARREREGVNVLQPPAPQPVAANKRKGQLAPPVASNGAARPTANGATRNGKAATAAPAMKNGKMQPPTPKNGRSNGQTSTTSYGKLRERTREVEQLEQQIDGLETRLRQLTTDLGAATEQRDLAAISRLGREYEQAEVELERKYKDWERLSSMVAALLLQIADCRLQIGACQQVRLCHCNHPLAPPGARGNVEAQLCSSQARMSPSFWGLGAKPRAAHYFSWHEARLALLLSPLWLTMNRAARH